VRSLARIDRLGIGAELDVSVAAVILSHEDFAARTRLDGLVGQDVLAPLVYTIDYARKVIAWGQQLAQETEGSRLPLQIDDGRLLVTLRQSSSADSTLRFIPDSGADGVVLFARRSGPPMDVTPLDVGVLRTVTGHKLVRRVLVAGLRVGDLVLEDQTALLVQPDHAGAMLGDGLLPLHLFARVTFNGPGGYLIVEGRHP
jgi:hypothetical protein